jgi:hypothetical protein
MTKTAIGFLLALVAGGPHGSTGSLGAPGAGPRSLPSVTRLGSEADAIFKGEVLETREVGTLQYTLTSGESAALKVMSSRLRVDHTLKGAAPAAGEVAITWYALEVPDGWGRLPARGYGLFFAAVGPGGYVVADRVDPWFPVSARAGALSPPPGAPLEAVEVELVNTLADPDVALACFAAALLRNMPYGATALAGLQHMARNHGDARCRGQALAALLARGHREALPLALQLLTNELSLDSIRDTGAAPLGPPGFGSASSAGLIRAFLISLAGQAVQGKEDLPYALELLAFPNASAKMSGLRGLRNLGSHAATPDAMRAVIKLLDAPDLSVRWQAVLTLAALTEAQEPPWLPREDEFRADPDRCTNLWKQSWQQHLRTAPSQ